MLTANRIAVGTFVWIALGPIACWNSAGGATPQGVRSTGTAARPAAVTKTPSRRAVAATYVRQPAEEVVEIDETEFIGEEGAYDAGCCADACGVPACNLFGGGFWVDMDFLLWWRDERGFPALLTTTPQTGGGPPGSIPGARVLFGGVEDESARPGGRLEFGLWLDPCRRTAVGVRYLAVADATMSAEYNSDGIGFLARPFTSIDGTVATSTAFPVINSLATQPTTGRLALRTDSEFQAGDVFFQWTLRQSACASFGFLAGYQIAQIDESLLIESVTVGVPPQSIAVSDLFDARNEFHGGIFGLRGDYRCGQFGVELLGRFGFGNMRQSIFIDGSTITTAADGSTDTRARGLLAQPETNGGSHQQDKFSFTNEAGVKLAFYPVEHLKLSLGYSLMYWSSVVRPGHEIDTSVDSRLLTALAPPLQPPATRPAFTFDPTDYLVHGLTLGGELRF